MSRRPFDPLAGIELLLVDGTNLLHALAQSRTPLPPSAVIGRLRAMIPPAIGVELVLDGSPEPGMRRQRVAAGIAVRYAAPQSADAAILERADRLGRAELARILLVSDDRELRSAIEARGGRTARNEWLVARLERGRLAAPAAGNPRSPGGPQRSPSRASGRGRHPC